MIDERPNQTERTNTMAANINYAIIDTPTNDPVKKAHLLLAKCFADCRYFLGNGNRNEKFLFGGSVDNCIAAMRKGYGCMEVKPVWLDASDIDYFEMEMKR